MTPGPKQFEYIILIFICISVVFLWSAIYVARRQKVDPRSKKFWIAIGALVFIITLVPVWVFSDMTKAHKAWMTLLTVGLGLVCMVAVYASNVRLRDILQGKKNQRK
jgi:uncharacterized membrane protein